MRKNNIQRLVFATLLLFGVAGMSLYFFYNNITQKEQEARNFDIKEEAARLQTILQRAIDDKQKALNAIALALSFDSNIGKRVEEARIPQKYATMLTQQLRRFSNYKNIWMELYNKEGHTLYRSWITQKDTPVSAQELAEVDFKKGVLANYIDVDAYDLCINSLLRLTDENGHYVGALDLKAHFNSISKELANYGADSVVIVEKEYRSLLLQPFTNLFVGDYYIANLDAGKDKVEFLQKKGVKRFMHPGYIVDGHRIVLSYPLKNPRSQTVAYYILFKDVSSIMTKLKEETFVDAMKIAFFTLLLVIVAVFLYESYLNNRQKRYYQSIIDNSRNIIIITDGKRLVDVNKRFLEFFGVESLDAFAKDTQQCLHDYFVKEEGYLDIDKTGELWFEYVYNNPDKKHKIKLDVDGEVHYFLVNVSKVETDDSLYSIVMSDITAEENYRLELERTAVTDPLTGIYNRGFFQKKLKEEILVSQRYSRPLSLVIMDIDHFKKINDKYGHDVGDKVLKEFTSLISKHIRTTDIFCRIGGEEFGLILRETSLKDAVRLAKKLNETVRSSAKKMTVPFSVSVGVVEYIKGESEEDIYKRADRALYKAKMTGRDKVVIG